MTEDGLAGNAVNRAYSTLRLFKQFWDSCGVDEIIAVATSAVRDAANGPAFISSMEQDVGLIVEVLSAEREAYYGVLGVLNEVPVEGCHVLDIGGSSAQISEVRGRRYQSGESFALGALALSERFVTSDPIQDSDYEAIEEEIRNQLWGIQKEKGETRLVGLGGAIRNLATIEAERPAYPLNSLHGFSLTRKELVKTIRQLRKNPLSRRQRIPGLNQDRADIILPGAMVVREVMDRLGVKSLQVSEGGLREGLFFERFLKSEGKPILEDVRAFSALNLGRNFDFDEPHAEQVRHRRWKAVRPDH